MTTIIWALIFILFLLWFVTRLIAWVLTWLISKYLRIDVRIGKVGFFNLKRVQFLLKNSADLEIDCIWISSSFVNNEIKTPLALCLGEIRIQTELREKSPTPAAAKPPPSNKISNKPRGSHIVTLVSILQFCGVYVKNVQFMLLKAPFPECLLHLTVQEICLDCLTSEKSIGANFHIKCVSGKVLKNKSPQPCIAEVSFSQSITVELERGVVLPPKSVQFSVTKPHLMFTEGFLSQLQTLKSDKPTENTQLISSAPATNSSIDEKIETLKQYAPNNVGILLEDTIVNITRDSTQRKLDEDDRHLVVTMRQIQFDGGRQSDSDNVLFANFSVVDFRTSSPQARFANLNRVQTELKLKDTGVDIQSQVYSAYLLYHHEEILYWSNVLANIIPPRKKKVKSKSANESKNKPLKDFLSKKVLSCRVQIWDLATSVAQAECSGFTAGLKHTKLEFIMVPSAQGSSSVKSNKVDTNLQLDGLYCKLAESQIAVDELCDQYHHWNTVLYLGTLTLKLNREEGKTQLQTTICSLQVEWSSRFIEIARQLFLTMIKRKSSSPSPPDSGAQLIDRENLSEECLVISGDDKSDKTDPFTALQGCDVQFKCTDVNILACSSQKVYAHYHLDQSTFSLTSSTANLILSGAKVVYTSQCDKYIVIKKSDAIHDYVMHLKTVKVNAKFKSKVIAVHVLEETYVLWNPGFHMCLHTIIQETLQTKAVIVAALQRDKDEKSMNLPPVTEQTESTAKSSFSISMNMRGNTMIAAQVSKDHRIAFSTPDLTMSITRTKIALMLDECSIAFDQHDIFEIKGVVIYTAHHSTELAAMRKSFEGLELPTNKAWKVSFDDLSVIFPHKYNFAACLEQALNIKKFLKTLHFSKKKEFTIDSPLPPDLVLIFKNIRVLIKDDIFQVKLGDNYMLAKDEASESEKRFNVLEKRINEIKKERGLAQVSNQMQTDLHNSLLHSNAKVYVERSQKLYTSHAIRTNLFAWRMENLEITALADRSVHGKENCIKNMQDIDKESPYPEEGLDFVTLFCRFVNVKVDSWMIDFRDYPQSFLDVREMLVRGRFMAAEQQGVDRAKRSAVVALPEPWDDLVVQKNMPALKFYHDFISEVDTFRIAYGANWEPCLAQVNLALDMVNKPSVDPSRPMPIWDKFRLLLHGQLLMKLHHMSWLYHASLDPYNVTEFMDWTWTALQLNWTPGKFDFDGNLDIYVRTASKYDDCNLIHLPNLKFCIALEWLCRGDPNDHHSVTPCAPDKVPEYSLAEHDSYSSFRSQNVNMSISFETKPPQVDEEGFDDIPRCLFYSSTMRFLEKIKSCMQKVSRPICRGFLFNNVKKRKPPLGKHFKNVSVSMNFNTFEGFYWASFAKQLGMNMTGSSLNLNACFPQTIVDDKGDGLYHRQESTWGVKKLHFEMEQISSCLCSTDDGHNISLNGNRSMRSPVRRTFFMSLSKLVYSREEEPYSDPSQQSPTPIDGVDPSIEDQPMHYASIYGLKGAWNIDNRNIIFGLYDGYAKAQECRRNLSSDAVKTFKVDNASTPMKGRTYSLTNSSSNLTSGTPASRIQSGHAHSMLQKLVAETDSKFVAFTEEPSGDHVDQLHGIAACETADVLKKNWLIELHNSQVMLAGPESAGYVIVCASKAEILACQHQPVWRDRQLKDKKTWVGSVEGMQYYATVDRGIDDEDVMWLTEEHIMDHSEDDDESIAEMAGSGHSVGGVVTVSSEQSCEDGENPKQLQRIISKCKCHIFYASYSEADPTSFTEVPLPPIESQKNMFEKEEGVDSLTLLHHDLNICTNSLQYLMILDLLNNLLLYVEPKKKAQTDKLQSMRFELHLTRIEDQKTPILALQESLRKMVLRLRELERELYNKHRELDENPFNESLLVVSGELEQQINELKEKIVSSNEELGIMLSCFKEMHLAQTKVQEKTSKARQVAVIRRNEVCFKHAKWRLTETDGQIGITDIVLRNFLYCKVNNNDDSLYHRLEVGWLKMQNLLPNTIYKEVIVPKDQLENQIALRIYCRVKPPVAGITVREHLELNCVPLTIQLTYQFFRAMMTFFFPGKNIDNEDDEDVEAISKQKKKDAKKAEKESKSAFKKYCDVLGDNIDKMKERAAQNNTFLFVKISEIPVRLSYKGGKEKNIEDVHDITIVLPTLEYHNQTWTWLDLMMAVKNTCKRVLVSQAIKQKLHMRTKNEDPVTDVQQEEDKAKMLFGTLAPGEKPTTKKSLFGGKSSK